MKPRDNRATLVAVAALFLVSSPSIWTERPNLASEGSPVYLPGSGGVAPGLHTGMPVDAVVADHAMPGISLEDEGAHGLACIGNRVRGAGGQTLGVVAGKRGGLAPGFIPGQFVGVESPEYRLEGVFPGTTCVVEAYGRGLMLSDFPAVAVVNCSPRAFDALAPESQDGRLRVDVRAVFSSDVAGPGLGSDPWIGDLEIDIRPDGLCFGDIVAIEDLDGQVSRFVRSGFITIGIVSHGPSPVAGHGIGITVLLSGPREVLLTRVTGTASLAPDLTRWSETEGPEWA